MILLLLAGYRATAYRLTYRAVLLHRLHRPTLISTLLSCCWAHPPLLLVWSWRGKSEFLDGGKRVLKLHRLTMLTLRTQPFRNSVWWQLVNPTASTAIVVAVGSRDMSCRVVIFVIIIGNGWKVRCSHWMQLNVKFFILPNQLGQHLENEQTKLHFQYDTDAYTRARFEVMKILPTPYDMNIFSKK